MGVILNIIHPLTNVENIISSMKTTNSNFAIVLATTYKNNEKLLEIKNLKKNFTKKLEKSLYLLYNSSVVTLDKR